jgi:hypothetical protein
MEKYKMCFFFANIKVPHLHDDHDETIDLNTWSRIRQHTYSPSRALIIIMDDSVVLQLFRHLPDLYALQLRCRSHPHLAVRTTYTTYQANGWTAAPYVDREPWHLPCMQCNANYSTRHSIG